MELKEAIEILEDYADWTSMLRTQCPDCMGEAIKVVLEELQSLHEEIEDLHDTIETLNEDIDYWKYKDCEDDTDWTHWEEDEEEDDT